MAAEPGNPGVVCETIVIGDDREATRDHFKTTIQRGGLTAFAGAHVRCFYPQCGRGPEHVANYR